MPLGLIPRLLATATATLALTTAGSATAATWSHVDLSHDVKSSSDGTTYTTDPTNAFTDITRVVAANNKRTIVVKVKTRAAVPTKNFMVIVDVKTSAARYSAFKSTLPGLSGVELEKGNTQLHCKGFSIVIDRTTRITTVALPRTCLGRPTWVKVGAGAVSTDSTAATFSADDGLSTKVSDDLVLSPKIYRG